MPLTIGKITLFTSLERNIFLLSSISIALFGISVSAIDMNEGKTLCKLGAIFVALLSIYNIFVANRYLNTKNNSNLLARLNRSAMLYSIILVLLCVVFVYSIIKHDFAGKQ